MADPSKRERILAVLIGRLERIERLNGFATDVGLTLYVGELPTLGPDDPDDAVALIVGSEQATWQQGKCFITLPIAVVALAKVGCQDAWRKVEAVIADGKRAMELEDRMLNGLLDQVKPMERGTVEPYPREPGSTTIGSSLGYVIRFTETWGAP